MKLLSTGGWNKHKFKQMVKGNQSLIAIDKCLLITPDIKMKRLEYVYDSVCESRVIYGSEK